MRAFVEVGLAVVLMSTVCGCPQDQEPQDDLMDAGSDDDASVAEDRPRGSDAGKGGSRAEAGMAGKAGSRAEAGTAGGAGAHAEAGGGAGSASVPNVPQVDPVEEPESTPRTSVPDELVGAWQSGPIDFAFWEAYKEQYWAGRNAEPMREAMIFREDGSAKYYRYDFAFTLYEKLIDCEGTVAFHDDGTFTFYPVEGRKRFFDFRYSANNKDRDLTAEELVSPELAGTRAYTPDPEDPDAIIIKVPSSAAYRWYRKE